MADGQIGLRWAEMRSLIATISVCLPAVSSLPGLACPAVAAATARGVAEERCPPGAVDVEPGASIQAAVDSAGDHAVFCLKNGIHRMQAIRPRRGQHFHGEGHTVLNGSRLLTSFGQEDSYWVANGQVRRGRKHGQCMHVEPACNLPEGFFIDDKPLAQVLRKDDVKAGRFYVDYARGKVYFIDDPRDRKVEVTAAPFAFESAASDVLIRNTIVEKYASAAQKGAIHAREATRWTIESSEVRLNSGAGIGVGAGSRVHNSDIHHNGQIGIAGMGRDILIEENSIWANNIYMFDFKWEAGGVKLALSDRIIFRGNHVYDNVGPGLWCDINCRNVVYEHNLVERNHDAGIFHEISFRGIIRNNVVRHNGIGDRTWFWGADVLLAASEEVEVYGNTLTVSAGGCGIVLIDQSRPTDDGRKYKTRNNTVHHNEMTFEGAACGGGASDANPGDENFTIITEGNNRFDSNVYRVSRTSGTARFVWGHALLDWDGLRGMGVEPNGGLVIYD